MVPAQFGWFAYGRDGQGGAEFLTPVAMWALVESSGSVRRVVGLSAHGLGKVTRVEELPGLWSPATSPKKSKGRERRGARHVPRERIPVRVA